MLYIFSFNNVISRNLLGRRLSKVVKKILFIIAMILAIVLAVCLVIYLVYLLGVGLDELGIVDEQPFSQFDRFDIDKIFQKN